MSRNNTDPPNADNSAETIPSNTDDPSQSPYPFDHVVALVTADETIVVYDEQQPTAWIQSTAAVPVGEIR